MPSPCQREEGIFKYPCSMNNKLSPRFRNSSMCSDLPPRTIKLPHPLSLNVLKQDGGTTEFALIIFLIKLILGIIMV